MPNNDSRRSNSMRYRRTNPQGEEQANPKRRPQDHITPSDIWRTKVQSGPVRQWKDMTPEERKRVMTQLRPAGTRP